jgi:hypothetical protein
MASIADKQKQSRARAAGTLNAREVSRKARNPNYAMKMTTSVTPKAAAPKRQATGSVEFNPRGKMATQTTRRSNANNAAYAPRKKAK